MTELLSHQNLYRRPYQNAGNPDLVVNIVQNKYRTDITREVAHDLITYADQYGLVFNERVQEVIPMLLVSGGHLFISPIPAILRYARSTGLWLPGKTRHYEVAGNRFCEASCYTRFSTADANWVEVSETVKSSAECERNFDLDIFNAQGQIQLEVMDEWRLIGDTLLAQVGSLRVARKALGTHLDGIHAYHDEHRIVQHWDYLERKKSAAKTVGA
jgi:hypothetical protein